MKIEHINPEGRPAYPGLTQVVAATGGRTLYIAGQASFDADGQLVGAGDYEAQTRQTCLNLVEALAAAGAKPDQIVSSTIYIAGLTDESFAAFSRGKQSALDGNPMPPTASTLVGVERLAYSEMLVEIDAIAVC